jgi:hypothetical protein
MIVDSIGMSDSLEVSIIVGRIVEKLVADDTFRGRIIGDPEEALKSLMCLDPSERLGERRLVKKQSPSPACRLTCDYSCHVSCRTTRAFPPMKKKN